MRCLSKNRCFCCMLSIIKKVHEKSVYNKVKKCNQKYKIIRGLKMEHLENGVNFNQFVLIASGVKFICFVRSCLIKELLQKAAAQLELKTLFGNKKSGRWQALGNPDLFAKRMPFNSDLTYNKVGRLISLLDPIQGNRIAFVICLSSHLNHKFSRTYLLEQLHKNILCKQSSILFFFLRRSQKSSWISAPIIIDP